MFKAIADLRSGDGRAAIAGSPAAPASFAVAEAERRQLTVIFCDLVGSTALSARFDPGDLREIVGAYHRGVADTVGRVAGFVAKYMGDGVLIYFGYPQAHEDDAERAVRAGLAVIGGGCVRKPARNQEYTCAIELDPVDYRLEQISSSGIGRQALPQAFCFSL